MNGGPVMRNGQLHVRDCACIDCVLLNSNGKHRCAKLNGMCVLDPEHASPCVSIFRATWMVAKEVKNKLPKKLARKLVTYLVRASQS